MRPCFIDFFPKNDCRQKVLALMAEAWRKGSGSWAWLLIAQGQDKALLYTGSTECSIGNDHEISALEALGRYLGFPASVLAVFPHSPQTPFTAYAKGKSMPEYVSRALSPFELTKKDASLSRLAIYQGTWKGWQGINILNMKARNALEARKTTVDIISRCPRCGEWQVDGCGCQSPNLIFPDFHTPVNSHHVQNRIRKYGLENFGFGMDYRQPVGICPGCKGNLIPVVSEAIQWKCADCGCQYRLSEGKPVLARKPSGKSEDGSAAAYKAISPQVIIKRSGNSHEGVEKRKDAASLPVQILNSVSAKYPNIWRKVDEIRAEKRENGKLPWDRTIFLPGDGWKALQKYYYKTEGVEADSRSFFRMMAAGAWRPDQKIVSFDHTLYNCLIATPFEGRLPAEVLRRFPAWSLYFDAPLELNGRPMQGFFAHLDQFKGFMHLCLYFVSPDECCYISPLELGDWTIKEALARNAIPADKLRLANAQGKENELIEAAMKSIEPAPAIMSAINLILYTFTEINHVPALSHLSGHPEPKRTKSGWRLFPPDRPSIYRLGEETGELMRQAMGTSSKTTGMRAGPCPHIRRGHWHHYWKGPRKSILDLKWLPPMPVAMADDMR